MFIASSSTGLFESKAERELPTSHLYGIASAHAVCPSKPSVLAVSR
jgi:hypothetical protein